MSGTSKMIPYLSGEGGTEIDPKTWGSSSITHYKPDKTNFKVYKHTGSTMKFYVVCATNGTIGSNIVASGKVYYPK